MKIGNVIYVLVCLFFINFSSCQSEKQPENENQEIKNEEVTAPGIGIIESDFTLLESKKLYAVKERIQQGDSKYVPAYDKLMRAAERALDEGPFSVLQKTQTAPSGDKHDYLSLAPYWWPDPDKPDGLPWIRRDGEINPMTRGENVDDPAKDKMIGNVRNLSLAYFFSGDTRYMEKTKELLRVWFVNPETKMNPNLNYAQGVPGSSEGRGFGIIEFSGISHVITAIEIFELENKMEATLSVPLRQWLTDYLSWLQTSELGLFEKSRENNHGTLYDIQEVALLLFLDKTDAAKTVLESVIANRIAPQITADGKQPKELERTKALTYSILNLSGLTKLAYLGRKKGVEVDLWKYRSPSGDMQKAYEYLSPYLNSENSWPYQQLGSMDNALERLRRMFVSAGSMLNHQAYCSIGEDLQERDHLEELLFPCNP